MTQEALTVVQAWSAVMEDVREIGKGERNKQQGFNFRGIDTVMNAVGPVLRKHGVVVTPYPEHITTSSYETSKGTTMFSAIVKMRYTVRGPAGDSFDGGAFGEAADAGDKAVSKAQSVAYRVFLLQGLTIPTDDPEPDAESHQRASRPAPQQSPVDVEFARLVGALSDDQKRDLGAWRTERGLNAPSQMSQDEKRMVIDHLKEAVAL
jgi:hypothetical protein